MLRRTKIVVTLGPATDDPQVLTETLLSGVDVVRINCSHGTIEEREKRIQVVRKIAKSYNLDIATLLDLQGPKIRIGKLQSGAIELVSGEKLLIDSDLPDLPDLLNNNKTKQIGTDYKQLSNDLKIGDILLLDDGRLSLEVKNIKNSQIECLVITGGLLKSNKGINVLGGGLSAPTLTDKDQEDIQFAGKFQVDYIALSFVRNKSDVTVARELLNQVNSQAGIIAKIERAEALATLDTLDEIIKVSDGVMVARGDLGVEIGDAELPSVQKHIINRARALDRVVITATQMMESMIENNIPTRAEVFDVANAVIDGTDAVMLSAETATGKHPATVVQAMSRICLGAERNRATMVSGHRVECRFERTDEAIAMATMYIANHLDVKAIIALTETGATPLWMSRIRSGIPIYALTRFEKTLLKMKLYRGVYPVYFDVTKQKREMVNRQAIEELVKLKVVKTNDWVVMARGDFLGVDGGCNTLKILKVGDIN
ncbi:MAG: pyruvate kinase [Gammaproteobacteria bacterium]|nr:pyruvate kinase [Gammaproteobacteria bacterium]